MSDSEVEQEIAEAVATINAKKTRKPRTKKAVVAEPVKKTRKPRAKKVVVVEPEAKVEESEEPGEVPVKKTRKKRVKKVVDPDAPVKDRAPNTWVAFVKAYRLEHPELTYREAMSAAGAPYKAMKAKAD